jgi:hypothetical protein
VSLALLLVLTASGQALAASGRVEDPGPPASPATVRGRVVSAAGQGLPDAHVFLLPPVPKDAVQSTSTAADSEGRFELRVPADRREVCAAVLVPNVERRMLPLRAGTDEKEVRIDPIGGTISVRYALPEDERVPVLFHADCFASLVELRAGVRADGELQEATLNVMEPGSYVFCLVAPDALENYRGGAPRFPGCAAGDLPQNGTLTLTE